MGLGHLVAERDMDRDSLYFQILSILRGPGLEKIDEKAEILLNTIGTIISRRYDSGDICFQVRMKEEMTGKQLQQKLSIEELQGRKYQITPLGN